MNALEYAVTMEIDGEKYYMDQAALNKGNEISVVCLLLAEAERAHAQLLRDWAINPDVQLPGKESYEKLDNVFKNAADFKSEIRATPSQLEFYRAALVFEQKSIDLYTDLLKSAADKRDRELFEFLVDQEKRHFALIDTFVTMLRHAEEWVESAEFGLRKEEY